jgi:restriction system protein
MWEIRIQHDGLLAARVLRGRSQAEAEAKALVQTSLWSERWAALQEAQSAHAALLTRQRLAIHGTALAVHLSAEASARLVEVNLLLRYSLATGAFFHWDMLKNTSTFPDLPVVPPIPRKSPPPPPKDRLQPHLGLIDKLIPSRISHKEASAAELYENALAAWRETCRQTEAFNLLNAQEAQLRARRYTTRKRKFRSAQLAQHKTVDALKRDFLNHDPDAVEYFFSEVLSRSAYPLGFPSEVTLQYAPSNRHLLVDYELPSLAAWPTCREIHYLPRRRALQELSVSDLWTRRSYDDALHQICLRVLSELFAHDDARAIDRIGFNGWVRSLDKATGNIVHPCVMSVTVKRDVFAAITLANVHAKACFKSLNGLSSQRLTDPNPIRPITLLDPAPHRFDGSDTARWDPHDNHRNLIAINR